MFERETDSEPPMVEKAKDSRLQPFEIKWDVNSDEENINIAKADFNQQLENISDSWLTENDKFILRLCFDEAIINAADDGNKNDSTKKVHVEIKVTDQEFIISVEDNNNPKPFNPETDVADPTAPENLMKTSGRGVFLIKTYFGENAKWEFLNPGNKVTMTRYRSGS